MRPDIVGSRRVDFDDGRLIKSRFITKDEMKAWQQNDEIKKTFFSVAIRIEQSHKSDIFYISCLLTYIIVD